MIATKHLVMNAASGMVMHQCDDLPEATNKAGLLAEQYKQHYVVYELREVALIGPTPEEKEEET